LGITAIGETRKVGNGGVGKGPAIPPKFISFNILFLATTALSPAIPFVLISTGRLGPEYFNLKPNSSP
jgi:hypothetical protein